MSVFDPQALVATLAHWGHAGRVWIAYSGGLDSSALLAAAAAARERLPGPLWAIHIDHGLHPDSGAWGEHCRSTCADLAIPCLTRSVAVKLGRGESLEAAAREARYRTFAALLAPGDLLLTAHHQDDQAETLLLALLRGSGVQGLAAMPAVAELGLGRLVRPLLGYSRAALEHFARAEDLTWLEDPSNAEPAMDRNYLRNQVMPLLRGRWPGLAATLSRSAAHCAEAAALVDLVAGREMSGLDGERPGTLSIPGLLGLELSLRKAVVRLWLRRRGFPVPQHAQLGRILTEVLSARPDADPLVAWPGCEVRRYRQDLFALRPLPAPPPCGLEIPWDGAVLELLGGLGRLERLQTEQQVDWIGTQPRVLRVRFGVNALRCRTPDSTHRRSLKKLFQEAGIPPWLRPYVPLVFDGDELVAIAGVCRCRPIAAVAQAPGPNGSASAVSVPLFPGVRWSGHPWESIGCFR